LFDAATAVAAAPLLSLLPLFVKPKLLEAPCWHSQEEN